MRVQLLFPIGVVLALLGCESPRVVDCTSQGTFVEAGGDHWCIYGRAWTESCPRLLPIEHDLPWGEQGCASREHDPLPRALCVATGPCEADAGSGDDT